MLNFDDIGFTEVSSIWNDLQDHPRKPYKFWIKTE